MGWAIHVQTKLEKKITKLKTLGRNGFKSLTSGLGLTRNYITNLVKSKIVFYFVEIKTSETVIDNLYVENRYIFLHSSDH